MSKQMNKQREHIAELSRALLNTQTHLDELNRKAGGSGVYTARQYWDMIKTPVWEKSSYVSDRRGPCGIHNHADHINTVGMADCAVVLNGIHFRTRHNDYSMTAPVVGKGVDWDGNSKFNRG